MPAQGLEKDGAKGDLIVIVEVTVPDKLTEDQERAMRDVNDATANTAVQIRKLTAWALNTALNLAFAPAEVHRLARENALRTPARSATTS